MSACNLSHVAAPHLCSVIKVRGARGAPGCPHACACLRADAHGGQAHGRSRSDSIWANSLRKTSIAQSVITSVAATGLLVLRAADNALGDRGATEVARVLARDRWLQRASARARHGAGAC